MGIVIKILRTIIVIVLVVLIAANVWMLVASMLLKQNPPMLFGYAQLTVTSGSMEPTFSPGDVVVIKEEKSYEMGEVVTFRLEGGSLVTHRIIGQNSQGFITKGDANNVEDDELLPAEMIVGEVKMVVTGMGKFLDFLKSPLGLLILIVVGFLLIELPAIIERKDRKPKGRRFNDTP